MSGLDLDSFDLDLDSLAGEFKPLSPDSVPGDVAAYRAVVQSKSYRAFIVRHGCTFHGFGDSETTAILNAHKDYHNAFHNTYNEHAPHQLIINTRDCFLCMLHHGNGIEMNAETSKVYVQEVCLFPAGHKYTWQGHVLSDTTQKAKDFAIENEKQRKL